MIGAPLAAGSKKTQDRKVQQLEAQMKQYNQDLNKSKMTGMFFVAVLMMGFISMFSTAYEGVVVAKLPFMPISFM